MRFRPHPLKSVPVTAISDCVLVLVMRKLDRELPFFFGFRRLIGIIRFAESEACILTRGGAHMANGADGRASSDHGLSRGDLVPVTPNARIGRGKTSNGRESTCHYPCRPHS